MSGIDPNGGGALVVPGGGGASLPTASAAGQVPVSDGAGSAYTATSAGDVVDAAIASVVGAVAGQAIVGDGLGGVTETSADVSAMLAASDAAAARTALGVAASASTPLFEAGNGWTIIASQVSGTAATTYANGVDGLPGLARFTMTTNRGNPTAAALNGPRIERALTWDFAKRWRIRVSFVGVSTTLPSFGANISVWLYLRDGAGGVYAKRIVIYYWNDAPGGPLAWPPWTGGTKEFRLNRNTTILEGMVSAAGVWSQSSSEVLSFTPTHVGIAGEAYGDAAGYIDVRDLVIESFV